MNSADVTSAAPHDAGAGDAASHGGRDARRGQAQHHMQNLSMQLQGNDFADLKYFEPGEHLKMTTTAARPPKLNQNNSF